MIGSGNDSNWILIKRVIFNAVRIVLPVHGKLRNTTINCADTNSRSKYRTYSGSTSHVVSYHKVLRMRSNKLNLLLRDYIGDHVKCSLTIKKKRQH